MSVTRIELPHWPSGPAIREEQRIAAAQRRLEEEAVKLWGSGSPCERPWRPDTGLLQRVPAELYPSWHGPFPTPWERDDQPWPGNDPFLPDLFGRPPSVPTDDPFLPRRLGTCCSQDYSGGYVRGSVATDVFRAFGLPDADPVSGDVDPSRPSTFRVMLAVSSDGLRWQRTNLILADRADVPTMVYDEATGRFWCFFVIFGAHTRHFGAEQEVNDEIVAAYSAVDSIETWTFRRISFEFSGTKYTNAQVQGFRKFDPCLVYARGEYFLYFTMETSDDVVETWVAKAGDLSELHWTVEPRPAYGAEDAVDPAVVKRSIVFEYFSWRGDTRTSYHAASIDGLSFTDVTGGAYALEWSDTTGSTTTTYTARMSNALVLTDDPDYRFYAFTEEGPDLHRVVSFKPATGGFQWEAEEGFRLVVDESTGLERGFVKEAAVARAGQSNCYLMAYSTGIPIPSP